ncbi:hypothetical protein AB7M56_006055 [Bradyrhizobium elkanii]|nr:hypothetical protein [Bradyrhizobium elkanii]MCS4066886.1 hypothetical protein [Bradyrhizobium elkanii]MCS4082421.1 hypothetical protein [Bradyrhizobium elkanii]MCW2127965.1 hypothetical protein [Bradyrhizobium elkanii]MCW2174706.1 hypothetical protein [Bradyrhizobium elkanii]
MPLAYDERSHKNWRCLLALAQRMDEKKQIARRGQAVLAGFATKRKAQLPLDIARSGTSAKRRAN